VQFFISPKPYLKEARILEQRASSFLGSFLITFFTISAQQYSTHANHIDPTKPNLTRRRPSIMMENRG
jgi:hypothetical protein